MGLVVRLRTYWTSACRVLSSSSAVLQIGLAYACGIVFAIGICGATSGGHFNPAVTLTLVLFKGFPPLKALRWVLVYLSLY